MSAHLSQSENIEPVQDLAVVLAAEGGNAFGLLLPLLLLAAFFFLAIRPQRQRQRQFAQIQASLTEGQEVVTTAGLYGTVVEVGPDFVLLEVAPGVRLKSARAAVGQILPEPASLTEPPEDRT